MKRSLRVDKIRLAALDAILRLYQSPEGARRAIPALRFLACPLSDIRALAQSLAGPVQALLGPHFTVRVVDCRCQVGSGANPAQTLPSAGLGIAIAQAAGCSLHDLAARLRALPMPVIGRISDDMLYLDLRTLEEKAPFLANLEPLRT